MTKKMGKLTALCLILTIIASIFGSQIALASGTAGTGTGNVGVAFTTGPRTVTFLRNDGTNSIHAAVIADGGSSIRATPGAQMPALPSRSDGYTFVGWNTHPDEAGEWFSDSTIVLDNILIYARWTQNWYTVQFINRDGSPISTMRVPHGGSAIAPPNPSITGWIFIGWDRPFTNVTEDTTVRAVFREVVVPTPPPVVPTPPPVVPTPPPVVPTPPPVVPTPPPIVPTPPPIVPTPPPVVPTPPPVVPAPPPPVVIVQPAAPSPAAPVVIMQPPASPPEPSVVLLQDEQSPDEPPVIAIIEPQPVPAAAPEPAPAPEPETIIEEPIIPLATPGFIFFAPLGSYHWAFLNLILVTLGAVLIPMALIKVLQRRKLLERKAEIELGSVDQDKAYIVDEDKLYQQRRLEWFTATAVLGGMGILIFVLTQDVKKTLALMDWWTIIHITIFTLEAIAFKLICKKEK